jgi:hypothetical protein
LITGVTVAVCIVTIAAFGTKKGSAFHPTFVPANAKLYHSVLPPKFGGDSRTVYVWKGVYADALAAAKKELLSNGWRATPMGAGQIMFHGPGRFTLVKGRAMDPGRFVVGAKSKNDARTTSWEIRSDYVSVIVDNEDGSLVDHARGAMFETFGIGR